MTAHLIPLFPLLAFVVNIILGRKLGPVSAFVSIVASGISLILSIGVFYALQAGQSSYVLGEWLSLHGVP